MNYKPELEAALARRQEDMVETLRRWVRIPSVKAEPAPGAPFGGPVRQALDAALADGARLELNPRDVDGYACDFEIGQGEETVAILAHLDVVPAGEGWATDPFGGDLAEGRIYGRGTCDDKGPAVAAMYAMRAVLDAGIPLKKKLRLILGCDEESGWECIRHYTKKIGMPETGFSPDAESPLINTEKGICQAVLRAAPGPDGPGEFTILSLEAGERPNVIPGLATAQIAGDPKHLREAAAAYAGREGIEVLSEAQGNHTRIQVVGVPGHGAMPSAGVNAASHLIRLLAGIGAGSAAIAPMIQALAQTAAADYTGAGFGIDGEDGVSGPLTMNLGILRYDGRELAVTLDIRHPVMFDQGRILDAIEDRLAPLGFTLERGSAQPPHHVPESSPIVQKLLAVYREATGDQSPPKAIGGGTYARALRQGVAFGAAFPGEPELVHQAGENLRVDHLAQNAALFAQAIVALCGED